MKIDCYNKFKNDTRPLVDLLTKDWMKYSKDQRLFHLRYSEILEIVKSMPENLANGILVDIGCGNAFMSILWAFVVSKVYAIDIDYANPAEHSLGLDYARKLIKMANINNITLKGGTAYDISLPDESVDVVFTHYVLDHLLDLKTAFREFERILKRGGYVIHSVPTIKQKYFNLIDHYTNPKELVKRIGRPLKYILERRWNELPIACLRAVSPIPPPHDTRIGIIREFYRYRPKFWRSLFVSNGYDILLESKFPKGESMFFIAKKDSYRK